MVEVTKRFWVISLAWLGSSRSASSPISGANFGRVRAQYAVKPVILNKQQRKCIAIHLLYNCRGTESSPHTQTPNPLPLPFFYLNPPSSIPLNSLLLFFFGTTLTCAGQTYSSPLTVGLGELPSLQLQICVISGSLPPPMTWSLYHEY